VNSVEELMAAVRRIALVLFLVAIPLLINTEILALPFPVSLVQRIFAVSQTSGLSETRVEKVTRSTLRYLRQRQLDQDLLVAYTAREVVHLKEARVRFWQSRLALVIFLAGGIIGYWRCWWSKSSIFLALRLAIVINTALGLLFLLIFPVAFQVFHQLLFTPGTYMFLPDDLLIRLFPYEFWWVMFSLVTLLSDIELGILWHLLLSSH
jgi:integral membrane protein (TIGR01906 family)